MFVWYGLIFSLIIQYSIEKNLEKNICADGWIQATWVDLGCVLFNSTKILNWEEANIACQEVENGRLLEIRTEEQLDFHKKFSIIPEFN